MILDGVVFSLTLNKAIRMRRVGFTGFLDVMLRDGEGYISFANRSCLISVY